MKYFLLIALLLAFAAFYGTLIDDGPVLIGDQTQYILLGRSIESGHGYRDIFLPSEAPHTKFPFGYPLVLSLVIRAAGYNIYLMKLLNILAAITILGAVYYLMKDLFDSASAAAIVILTGISFNFIYHIIHIHSETFYTLFSVLSLICVMKYQKDKKILSPWLFAAALSISFTACTRLVGVSMIAASAVYLFFDGSTPARRSNFRKAVVLTLLASLPLVLWLVRNWIVKTSVSADYITMVASMTDPFDLTIKGSFFLMMLRNIYALIFYAIPAIIAGSTFDFRSFGALALFFLPAVGFIYCFMRRRGLLEWYILFYLAITVLYFWTAMAGIRFMTPLAPFIFYYLIRGIAVLVRIVRAERLFGVQSSYVAALAFILLGMIRLGVLDAGKAAYSEYSAAEGKSFLVMADWVKYNTAPDAVFTGACPGDIYFYCNRKAVILPNGSTSAVAAEAMVKRERVAYVAHSSIYYGSEKSSVTPVLALSPAKVLFKNRYGNENNYIYEVVRP